jgi:PDZ domain-containing secreted protein
LGDVMQESARAALSWLRSEAERLKIKLQVFDESDIHLHVPAGATPKEGPSAGIGLATALVSLFTGRPVKAGVAMTGEITLRGRVLPVGGIRDKVLAAQRAGIRIVVLPKHNAVDLDDVPAPIRRRLRFVLVDHIDEVLQVVLEKKILRKKETGRTAKKAKKKATKRKPTAKKVAVKKPAAKKVAVKKIAKKEPAVRTVAVKKVAKQRAAGIKPVAKKAAAKKKKPTVKKLARRSTRSAS